MTFYIQRDGEPKQLPVETLTEMVKKGELRADEYVFDGRTQKWVGATQLAELADAWKAAKGGAASETPAMAAATPKSGSKKRSSKKFSETSWFMSAVTYEEGGLTPSEMPPMDAGDKFDNLPPVPQELREKFSLRAGVAQTDDKAGGSKGKKK